MLDSSSNRLALPKGLHWVSLSLSGNDKTARLGVVVELYNELISRIIISFNEQPEPDHFKL